MSDQLAVGIIVGVIFLTIYVLVGIVLGIIGKWRIFKKAGEKGWKALIPFYSSYILYKLCWNWKPFAIELGLTLASSILGAIGAEGPVFNTFSVICSLTFLVLYIEQCHRLSLSFGHKYGYTFGLVLLNPIYLLILGCGKSEYKKVEYVVEEVSQEDRKVFAKGYCFTKIFLLFTIGCLIGTYWEELLYFFQHSFQWTNRQGVLYGPFSPIYGIGLAAYVAILGKNSDKRSYLKTFIVSFFLGGAVEYLTSFLSEKLLGASFWDYHDLFLNINGRTTIPYMVVWGIAGVLLMKLAYPRISRLIEKIPYGFAHVAYPLFVVFLSVDMFLTASAFMRMDFRDQGMKAHTAYEEFLDLAYPDDYMAQAFPVMGQWKQPDKSGTGTQQ